MSKQIITPDKPKLDITYVAISELSPAPYNPRKWSEDAIQQLTESINRFGMVDPIIVNNAPERHNVVIGGHFRLKVAADLGHIEVPVAYVSISDLAREQELNLRLNRNTGEWDWNMLAEFDESLLTDIGFSSVELDTIFNFDVDTPEVFNLEEELAKLDITSVKVQKGDIYQLGESRLMCGDSTVPGDITKLIQDERADMCLTDPPYILDYVNAKRHGKPTEGFGAKRNRRYLETDVLPDNFTELWVTNISSVAKSDFSIIVYENWKNLRTIWAEVEKYWKVKNMIVWHLPNRHQGFSAKRQFFSKHDIAIVGASGDVPFNSDNETAGMQEEYETALYAISGKPHWEGYERGKKNQPTDFIEFNADDLKHSGQGIIFGTKPLEILIPYIKMLTKRGDLIIEPFGGSGSTLIAATKMGRRCYLMEKSPVYAEVIMKRWETTTGLTRVKLDGIAEH
jgi:DNA modification methylase